MSVSASVLLAEANHHVEAAVEEENGDGDALIAARHYTRAVELILHAANETNFSSASASGWCLANVRERLCSYLERAALLQRVGIDEVTEEAQQHGDAMGIPGAASTQQQQPPATATAVAGEDASADAVYRSLPQGAADGDAGPALRAGPSTTTAADDDEWNAPIETNAVPSGSPTEDPEVKALREALADAEGQREPPPVVTVYRASEPRFTADADDDDGTAPAAAADGPEGGPPDVNSFESLLDKYKTTSVSRPPPGNDGDEA